MKIKTPMTAGGTDKTNLKQITLKNGVWDFMFLKRAKCCAFVFNVIYLKVLQRVRNFWNS